MLFFSFNIYEAVKQERVLYGLAMFSIIVCIDKYALTNNV
jgi:hypothetical protein